MRIIFPSKFRWVLVEDLVYIPSADYFYLREREREREKERERERE